jgi:hypothetical protein
MFQDAHGYVEGRVLVGEGRKKPYKLQGGALGAVWLPRM